MARCMTVERVLKVELISVLKSVVAWFGVKLMDHSSLLSVFNIDENGDVRAT